MTQQYQEIDGTYGSHKTECNVFIDIEYGWYVVEGGSVVNNTITSNLVDGVDVEELEDFDCFTMPEPIETIEDFIKAIEE